MKFESYRENASNILTGKLSDLEKIETLRSLIDQLYAELNTNYQKRQNVLKIDKYAQPTLDAIMLLSSLAFCAHTILKEGQVQNVELVASACSVSANLISSSTLGRLDRKTKKYAEDLTELISSLESHIIRLKYPPEEETQMQP